MILHSNIIIMDIADGKELKCGLKGDFSDKPMSFSTSPVDLTIAKQTYEFPLNQWKKAKKEFLETLSEESGTSIIGFEEMGMSQSSIKTYEITYISNCKCCNILTKRFDISEEAFSTKDTIDILQVHVSYILHQIREEKIHCKRCELTLV